MTVDRVVVLTQITVCAVNVVCLCSRRTRFESRTTLPLELVLWSSSVSPVARNRSSPYPSTSLLTFVFTLDTVASTAGTAF